MARFPIARGAAPVVFALGVVAGVVFAASCGGGGGGSASAAPGGSQGTWHVWSPTVPISATVGTSLSTIATTQFTPASPDDAILAVRVEGTADVALSAGVLFVRLRPVSTPEAAPLATAQIPLKMQSGQTFAAYADFGTATALAPALGGAYEIVVDGVTSGSGTTDLDLTAFRVKVLVLEGNDVRDPSPLFP
jgi:hypothetical protein